MKKSGQDHGEEGPPLHLHGRPERRLARRVTHARDDDDVRGRRQYQARLELRQREQCGGGAQVYVGPQEEIGIASARSRFDADNRVGIKGAHVSAVPLVDITKAEELDDRIIEPFLKSVG